MTASNSSRRTTKATTKPAPRPTAAIQAEPDERHPNPHYPLIWRCVAAVPSGRVASYGQIAALAGLPGRARLVGRALRETPDGLELPWHRVLTASGKLAFPADSPPFLEQKRRLAEEGVLLTGHRVDLRRYGLDVSPLDAALWSPAHWD